MTIKFDSFLGRHTRLLMGSAALATCFASPVFAQDTTTVDTTVAAETETESTEAEVVGGIIDDSEDEARQERVVITGSRISRSTFTSISPVQVITTDFSREVGLIDPADILQDSTAASGQQIDDSFQGFVLDNGPGSSTVSLRALGSGRTLVLINGRRMAPIGVEGAPADPSINLIPSSFVESYEILLDGASSIYGSDAVAGVANVILKNDYDGFEFGFNGSAPVHGGGESFNAYGSWGKQMDKGYIAAAIDYEEQQHLKLRDRDWSDDCVRLAEITESGEVRQDDLSNEFDFPGMGVSPCEYFPLGGRMFLTGIAPGSVYYTPGTTNVGIPNYSDSSLYGVMIDGNGDGLADFSFFDYTTNGTEEDRAADILGESKQFSAMLKGDYDIGILGDATAYGELMYVTQDYKAISSTPQVFPTVPGSNPFNPCNPDGIDGIDCGASYSNFLLTDENYRAAFADYYGPIYGFPGIAPENFAGVVPGPTGAFAIQPIVGVVGDRDYVESTLEQTRFVAGLEGNLPFINWGTFNNWTYDASLTYSKSVGESLRTGIRNDRLLASVNTSAIDPSTGNVVCGVDGNSDGVPDGVLADGTACVPVNFFSPTLYEPRVGDFATAEERDFIFGDRTFETTYEQTVLQGYATGDLFTMPGGVAAGVVGLEYRKDELASNPNDVARDGLLFGYFFDEGANGSLETQEIYGELELPLLADVPGATELTLNLSGRYTDTEFAGDATTYAVKAGWRPFNSLLLRGTVGTSFRAPNVREQFLRGQSGFQNVFDPCYVPEEAINGLTDEYDSSQDPRDPTTLANCVAGGVDPTSLGGGGVATYSTEIVRVAGTSIDLEPETSDSYSYGFVFEQPFTDAFDLTLGVTYYNIEVNDAIARLSSSYVVNQCYVQVAGFESPFCDKITRASDGTLDRVQIETINVASEISSGWDINLLVEKDFAIGSRDLNASWDLTANNPDEVSFKFADEPTEDYVGEFGIPDWTIQSAVRLEYDDFRFTWRTEVMTGVEQDPDFVDPFSSFTQGGASYTCLGPAFGDELCREIGFADDYVTHDASVAYNGESWGLVVGVRNVFDEDPPFVSPNEVSSISGTNAPLGYGYDILGRTFFLSLEKQF